MSSVFALKFALRDLRGGLKGFRIFLACLALGVASISGVGTITSAILQGLANEGQTLLGGDVELTLTQRPALPAEKDYLQHQGFLSELVSLNGMAYAPRANDRTLVDLRAVDHAYPLFGRVELAGAPDIQAALKFESGRWGVAISPDLAARLDVAVGDALILGDLTYDIRAILKKTPDNPRDGMELAPPVMVSLQSLPQTGLVQLGSLIRYQYRLKLQQGGTIESFKQRLHSNFPDAAWRLRDRTNGAPGVRQFVDRMDLFLTLVGLTALVVGGVGVGNAVRVHLDSRIETIATLKTLGATGRLIFSCYMTQVLLIAAAGIIAGVIIGAFGLIVFQGLLADRLPVPPVMGFYPVPLMLAAAYGFLVTLAFSVWPLAHAQDIPAAALYRRLIVTHRGWPAWPYLALVIIAVTLLLVIALAFSDNFNFSAGFAGAAAGSLALLWSASWMIRKIARKVPRVHNPGLRIAIANLYRPGAATGAVVLSLGLGLTLFAAIVQIQGNITARVQDQLPGEAPAFFFIDIQKDQISRFRAIAGATPGVTDLTAVPYMRGRITEVKDIAVTEARIAPEARWVVRGDRGLTYAATLPKGNQLTAGTWWPAGYDGPPQISFDAGLAKSMGLRLGDSMTVNVLGRDIRATIVSLREIDWGTLGVNFAIIFDPHTLRDAPHTYLASLKVPQPLEAAAHKTLTRAFPNVSAVRVRDILDQVNKLLNDVGRAVEVTATITILSGILVLAGAIAAGQRQRLYDSVILKILGATRFDILKTFMLEYALLGLVAGAVAMALGTLGAWAVVTFVMDMQWTFELWPLVATIMASLGLTVAFGMIGAWSALGIRPATALRKI